MTSTEAKEASMLNQERRGLLGLKQEGGTKPKDWPKESYLQQKITEDVNVNAFFFFFFFSAEGIKAQDQLASWGQKTNSGQTQKRYLQLKCFLFLIGYSL